MKFAYIFFLCQILATATITNAADLSNETLKSYEVFYSSHLENPISKAKLHLFADIHPSPEDIQNEKDPQMQKVLAKYLDESQNRSEDLKNILNHFPKSLFALEGVSVQQQDFLKTPQKLKEESINKHVYPKELLDVLNSPSLQVTGWENLWANELAGTFRRVLLKLADKDISDSAGLKHIKIGIPFFEFGLRNYFLRKNLIKLSENHKDSAIIVFLGAHHVLQDSNLEKDLAKNFSSYTVWISRNVKTNHQQEKNRILKDPRALDFARYQKSLFDDPGFVDINALKEEYSSKVFKLSELRKENYSGETFRKDLEEFTTFKQELRNFLLKYPINPNFPLSDSDL